MSGSPSQRAVVVTASARILPALMYSIDAAGQGSDLHSVRRSDRSVRGRTAAIGHVNHFDTGHHLEQLAGHVAGVVPMPADAMLILPGVGFGVGDELGNRLGWNRWMHHHKVTATGRYPRPSRYRG